jgi:hypothetical protein
MHENGRGMQRLLLRGHHLDMSLFIRVSACGPDATID